MAISPKHKLMADTYLANGMKIKEAYFAVYGQKENKDPAHCYVIMKRPEVQEYIEKKRQEAYESLNIDAMRVMEEISHIAFGKDASTKDKLKALELLSKNLSLQTVKTENKDTIEVQLVED